jgi:hypothetical protein
MAAISFSISRGVSGTKISDITVGTSAPGTADIELRWNTTDSNAKSLTKEDVVLACEAFKRALLQGGTTVFFTSGMGI